MKDVEYQNMSDIEFLVYDIRSEPDVAFVAGIVNKGGIPIGTKFTCVGKTGVGKMEVQLVVAGITAYSHAINELPSGMSGELTLRGMGAELIKKHDMLRT